MYKKICISIFLAMFFIGNLYSQNTQTGIETNNIENSGIETNNTELNNIGSENLDFENNLQNISNTSNTNQNKKIKNYRQGLYFEQNVEASYAPFNVSLNTKFFYKIPLIKKENSIFTNSSFYVGIHNIASIGYDMLGVFANFDILKYFSFNVSAYYTFAYNAMKFGYIGLSDSKISTSPSYVNAFKTDNAQGYMISLNPKVSYSFNTVSIENSTTINFVSLGKSPYYFDRRTFLNHKKDDIEIISDFSIMAEIDKFKLGPMYTLTYILGTKILTHKIGVSGYFENYFLDGNLKLYVDVNGAWNLLMPHYENTVHTSVVIGIEYKII